MKYCFRVSGLDRQNNLSEDEIEELIEEEDLWDSDSSEKEGDSNKKEEDSDE